jgi:hypothetical protein
MLATTSCLSRHGNADEKEACVVAKYPRMCTIQRYKLSDKFRSAPIHLIRVSSKLVGQRSLHPLVQTRSHQGVRTPLIHIEHTHLIQLGSQ